MRDLGIDLLLRQARKTGRAASGQIGCGRVLGKDSRRGAATLGAGAIVRGQTGAAAVAEHELGVLGAIARTNVCVAIGAERGAVLYGLKAMRADHGILFPKQFKQSRLEHNIATPPQAQGTNSTSQDSLLGRRYFFFFLGIDTLIPWADLVTRERLAPALFFFLG